MAGPLRKRPVLLVPGAFGQDLLYWNLLQYGLERAGYPVYRMSFPRFTLVDLRLCARLLAERVDAILASEGTDRVHVVAHSMGGLVVRWHLRFLGGLDKVDRIAFLGTPHHGTYTGVAGILLMGARQILPRSQFLQELNAGDEDPGRRTLNIWSRLDVVVLPRTSAILEGPNVENRESLLSGHWGLLVSPGVVRWVRDFLETGQAGPPSEGEPAHA